VRLDAVGQRENVRPRRHDLANDLLAELDNAADDRDLFALTNTFQFTLAQQILNPVALQRLRCLRPLANEDVCDGSPGGNERRGQQIGEPENRKNERRNRRRPPARHCVCPRYRRPTST
jgi:hypothetical protein